MKIVLGYPTPHEEIEIVQRMGVNPPVPEQVLDSRRDRPPPGRGRPGLRRSLACSSTRSTSSSPPGRPSRSASPTSRSYLEFGASPRASLGLVRAARAIALLRGRTYAVPQDVFDVAPEVLRHRLVLSYEALAQEVDSETILARVLSTVPAPRVTPSQGTETWAAHQQAPAEPWYPSPEAPGTDANRRSA